MQQESFLKACKEAEELVSSVGSAFRPAAFQVALGMILSGSSLPGNVSRQSKSSPTNGNGDAPRSETQRRILELVTQGFFDEPRLPNDVRDELRTQGFHHNPNDVRMSLLRLAQKKMLRRLRETEKTYRYARP